MGFKAQMRSGEFDFEIEYSYWEDIKDEHLNIEWEHDEDDVTLEELEEEYEDASPEFRQEIRDHFDPPAEMSRKDYWPSLAYAVDEIGEANVIRLYVKVDPKRIADRLNNFEGTKERRKALKRVYKTMKENIEHDPREAWYMIGEIFYSKTKREIWWITDNNKFKIEVPEKAYYCAGSFQFPDDQQLEFNQLDEIQEALRFFAELIKSNDALPMEQPTPTFDISYIDDVNERIMERFGLETEDDLEDFMNDIKKQMSDQIDEIEEDEDE